MLSDKDRETIDCCALRFDGHAYAESRKRPDLLPELTGRFVKTLKFSSDRNNNLAAFFALQRFLGKWGGEMLPESSRDWIAFKFLYLHLYRVDIPSEFRLAEHHASWARRHAHRAERVAARLRVHLASPPPAESDSVLPGDEPHASRS